MRISNTEGGGSLIQLSNIETTILFTILETKIQAAKKSELRRKDSGKSYKSQYVRIKNKTLIEWQEQIDKYIQANLIMSRYEGSPVK